MGKQKLVKRFAVLISIFPDESGYGLVEEDVEALKRQAEEKGQSISAWVAAAIKNGLGKNRKDGE